MVKNCRVLINNEAVTVIEYDGVLVQIPAIHKETKNVNVILQDGRHIVVDDDYEEPVAEVTEKPKKKANKKTTIDESANETSNVTNESLADIE